MELPARQRLIWLLIGAMCVAALAIQVVHGFDLGALRPTDALALVLLSLAFGASERTSLQLRVGRETHTHNLHELPLVAGLVFAHPLALVLAYVLGPTVVQRARRVPGVKIAFNAALGWLISAISISIWHPLLGDAAVVEPRGWVAVMVIAATASLTSGLLVLVVVSLSFGRVDRASVRQTPFIVVSALANGSFALVAAFVLDVDVRAMWTLVAIALGLFVAHRAFNSLQRRHQALEQVAEFSRTIGHELNAEAVALTVIDGVRTLLHVDVVELVLFDGPRGFRFLSRTDEETEISRTRAGALADHFVDEAWDGAPVLATLHARSTRLRHALGAAGTKDALIAPLTNDRRIVGSLLAADRVGDVGTFDRHEATLLAAFANHASVALKNGNLADQLRREAIEKEHQALHDGLTGLPNRTLFHRRVATWLAAGEPVAVLLMDLDRFKEINDTLGHHTGDQLLVEVARRLRRVLPEGAVGGRLGGDEFVVGLRGAGEHGARELAELVRAALGRPVVVEGLSVEVDLSVGAALAPLHGHGSEALLQHADVAMYSAKAAHTGYELYAADRDTYDPRRLALVADLRRGIERGELVCHYQPKVAIDTGRLVGVEALVRWQHPVHGLITPDDFVPTAEQTGLIRPLTLAVLREATERCAAWRAAGTELSVAVNLSPRSLLDALLVGDVEAALASAGLPGHALTLEITEGTVMADPLRTGATLRRLAGLGVQISVDDFGTGYSSLTYLKRLPVDEIKIDRSFVQSMVTDPNDAAIVSAIAELSRTLGKRVVAEGVEDAEAFERLGALGVDHAQGYWISRPLDAQGLLRWVREWDAALTTVTPLRRWPAATVLRS